MRIGLASAVLVAALATGGSVRATEQLLVPERGALLGAYVNPDALVPGTNVGVEYQWQATQGLEGRLGRRFDVLQFFWSWDDRFPDAEFEGWAVDHGSIPLISWHGVDLAPILAGRHDGWIAERARAVRALNAPVFLRFAWEMNGDWYPWSGARNGADRSAAAAYVRAWRRVHGIFAEEGADNAVWVWAPNAFSFPDEPWNDPRGYYPGDDYVDWVGIDAYNVGTWISWDALLSPHGEPSIYAHFAGRKPIMIAETGSQEAADADAAPAGASKAAWIADVRRRLPDRYPEIRAIVWYHLRSDEHDFRADSSPQVLSAFRGLAGDSYFAGFAPG